MRLLFFNFILLISFCMLAHAASNSADLSKLLESVKTMQADFTQTVSDNHGQSVQTSYGHMALQRPGKFRWEIKKPIPQLIVANDTRLWIYDPDLQQVTIRSLGKVSVGTPALLLSHVNIALDKDFNVKQLPKKPTELNWFALTPKQQNSTFASIQMGFNNQQLREMRFQDQLGHTTLIRFAEAKFNNTLPSALFNFKAPANVDVIDESRRH